MFVVVLRLALFTLSQPVDGRRMLDLSKPISLNSAEFTNNKFAICDAIREQSPVHRAKISMLTVYTVARHEDCAMMLKDPRVLRNRSVATGGGSRIPIPMPKGVKPLVHSMIQEDDPNHKRLRDLVRHAFKPQAIKSLEDRIEIYTDELLDGLGSDFELQSDFALHLPVRLISEIVGVDNNDMPQFQNLMNGVSKGFSGLKIFKTLFFDMPKHVDFVRDLVRRKVAQPGDDILTQLITAEDESGDKLTEDELVAMVFLLVVAGFETTVHLISNGIHTLLTHPDQLALLRANPALIHSAVEEILRHRGPVQSTKPGYAKEDIELHGKTIPKGKPIMPLFAAANHDPRVFDEPLRFDITREPNRHLGFGHGVHFCLGAHLARAEARIAILKLLERYEHLDLALPNDQLQVQAMPGWHRYDAMPLTTRRMRQAA